MTVEDEQDATLEVLLGSGSPDDLPDWTAALRHVPLLTQREREVFGLLADGASNREISTALLIAERTVKKHVGSIITKLDLDSRLQVGLVALTHRVVEASAADPATPLTVNELDPNGRREAAIGAALTPEAAGGIR